MQANAQTGKKIRTAKVRITLFIRTSLFDLTLLRRKSFEHLCILIGKGMANCAQLLRLHSNGDQPCGPTCSYLRHREWAPCSRRIRTESTKLFLPRFVFAFAKLNPRLWELIRLPLGQSA